MTGRRQQLTHAEQREAEAKRGLWVLLMQIRTLVAHLPKEKQDAALIEMLRQAGKELKRPGAPVPGAPPGG
jgi:hypothetical protein